MLAVSAAVFALVALGCGSEDTASQPAKSITTVEPAPSVEPPAVAPEAKPRARALRPKAYRDSKDVCGVFSAKQLAKEYGGDPSDPASVANAYADQSYRPAVRSDAASGCLAGLRP